MTKARRQTILTISILALVALAVLLVLGGCRDEARVVRERIAINANADSYVRNGYDIILYSDDRSTQKLALEGSAGNIDAEGTLDVAGNTTLAGTLDVAGGVQSATGAFTFTDAVNITSTLDVDGALNADGATTLNSTLDVDGAISSGTGGITLNDTVNIVGAVDADSTLNVDGASTLVGDVTLTADIVVGLFGRLTAQTAITVTGGGTLTPTGTYQPIQAAGAVGLSDIAITTAGDVLVLTNISATTITITDTGTTMLSANRAIAQYDTLVLLCDGTNWLELSFTNN